MTKLVKGTLEATVCSGHASYLFEIASLQAMSLKQRKQGKSGKVIIKPIRMFVVISVSVITAETPLSVCSITSRCPGNREQRPDSARERRKSSLHFPPPSVNETV